MLVSHTVLTMMNFSLTHRNLRIGRAHFIGRKLHTFRRWYRVICSSQVSEDPHHARLIYTEMFICSHFGTFIFTETLLPLLIKTAKEPSYDVRIVNVSNSRIKFHRHEN